MGTFKYPLRISGMDSRYTLNIEATVDTGCTLHHLARLAVCGSWGLSRWADAGFWWVTVGAFRWTLARPG